jgi:hypothetical protein
VNKEDFLQDYDKGISALSNAVGTFDYARSIVVFVLFTVPAYLAEADAATIFMSGFGGVFVFSIFSYLVYCYTAKNLEPRWLRERRNRRKIRHKIRHK